MNEIRNQIHTHIRDQVYSEVRYQVTENVGYQLYNRAQRQLRDTVWGAYQVCNTIKTNMKL